MSTNIKEYIYICIHLYQKMHLWWFILIISCHDDSIFFLFPNLHRSLFRCCRKVQRRKGRWEERLWFLTGFLLCSLFASFGLNRRRAYILFRFFETIGFHASCFWTGNVSKFEWKHEFSHIIVRVLPVFRPKWIRCSHVERFATWGNAATMFVLFCMFS